MFRLPFTPNSPSNALPTPRANRTTSIIQLLRQATWEKTAVPVTTSAPHWRFCRLWTLLRSRRKTRTRVSPILGFTANVARQRAGLWRHCRQAAHLYGGIPVKALQWREIINTEIRVLTFGRGVQLMLQLICLNQEGWRKCRDGETRCHQMEKDALFLKVLSVNSKPTLQRLMHLPSRKRNCQMTVLYSTNRNICIVPFDCFWQWSILLKVFIAAEILADLFTGLIDVGIGS